MFKKNPPLLPDFLFPFILGWIKLHFPTVSAEDPKKHDLINEAHCAAILMEGLIKIPRDEMPDALADAFKTAKTIYEREVINLTMIAPEDYPQASISLARLACDILLMRPPSKRSLFKKKKAGEA